MDLSRPDVIELIRRNYVPAAAAFPALAKLATDGKMETLPRGQTAFYIVSPEGKLIQSQVRGIGGEALVAFLKAGISKFGNVAPRPPQPSTALSPNWGIGELAGKARVGLFFRMIGANSEYRIWNIDLKHLSAMAPTKVEPGASYAIPQGIVRELLPVVGYIPPWIPDRVRKAQVTATVVSVNQSSVDVRLEGALAGNYTTGYPADGQIKGLLTFSRSGRPLTMMVVCQGTYNPGWTVYKTEGVMDWKAGAESVRSTRSSRAH